MEGKIAVITGCQGLLGPIWSQGLLEAGANIVGIDIKENIDHSLFHKLEEKFTGERIRYYKANVLLRNDLESVLTTCKKGFGIPTILVNNAGLDRPPSAGFSSANIKDVTFEAGLKIVEVNLLGANQVIQVFGEEMVEQKQGSIINIGSLYGSVSPDSFLYAHLNPRFLKPPMYGASKAGLIQLTKQYAEAWGRFGIRVNTLSPGGVYNNQDRVFRRKFCSRVPLGRMACADDLIGPLIFLASDASSYITGQNIQVDGGFTIL